MPEVSGAADQPRGFPSALPPLPAAAGITGWRSWWDTTIGLGLPESTSADGSGVRGPGAMNHARRCGLLWAGYLAYELAVGAALSPMVNAARVLGLLGVLIALTLSLPATLLLAAAGQITYATRHTPGAPPGPVGSQPHVLCSAVGRASGAASVTT